MVILLFAVRNLRLLLNLPHQIVVDFMTIDDNTLRALEWYLSDDDFKRKLEKTIKQLPGTSHA